MLRDNYIQAKVPANGIRDVDQGRAFAVKEPGSPHDLSNRKIPQPTCLVSRRSHARYDSTVVRDWERLRTRVALGYTDGGGVPPTGTRGKATWKVLPPAPLLSAQIRPPWRFTISLLM